MIDDRIDFRDSSLSLMTNSLGALGDLAVIRRTRVSAKLPAA